MKSSIRPFAIAATAAIAALLSVAASAATIDFNATTAGQYLTADYGEDGFTVQRIGGHYDFFGPGGLNCNLVYSPCTTNFLNVDDSAMGASTIRLTLDGGGNFDLFSLDLIESYQYNQQTFQFSACGTSCLVRSSNGGELSLNTNTPITLTFDGAAWRSVSWIEFYSASAGAPVVVASAAIDNINVAPSVVPAPAAGWLFATGLAAAFGRRLRRAS